MKLGLICETKERFSFESGDPEDIQSELLSVEEENELVSGLRDAGHEVIRIRDARHLLERSAHWQSRCELLFNRSTGYRGDHRALLTPAILEAAGIPYVGSDPYVHGLVRNKYHTKLVVAAAGVPTPPSVLVADGAPTGPLAGLKYPAIVKPVGESSSLGIEIGKSVVSDPAAALLRAQEIIRRYRQPALVETFVPGVEIEVPVLIDPAPRALGALAISLRGRVVSGDDYLTSANVSGDEYGFVPPPASLDVDRALAAALESTGALGLRDYGRVDLRVSEDGTPWFIEANSLPHIQRHSSFFVLAKARGLAYHEMLNELVDVASRRLRRS